MVLTFRRLCLIVRFYIFVLAETNLLSLHDKSSMNTVKLQQKFLRSQGMSVEFNVKKKLLKYTSLSFRGSIVNIPQNILEDRDEESLSKYPNYDGLICSLHQYNRTSAPRIQQRLGSFRNPCSFTGRPRGVVSRFKMSRMVFKELSALGLIPGVKRASW